MRRISYMLCAGIMAIALVASDAACQNEQPTQTAERKGLIFRLVDAVRNLPFIKKTPVVGTAPVTKSPDATASSAPVTPAAPITPATDVKTPGQPPAPGALKELPPEVEKARAEIEAQGKKTRSAMTKEELLEDIQDTLDGEDEVLDFIPELKKVIEPGGKTSYTYEGTPLSGLDRELLDKIFVRVNQTATRITTQRIQDQLELIRQVESLQRTQMRVGPPQLPPALPQLPPQSATQPPKVPQTPPRVPPSPPPQPPNTRR